MNSGSWLSDYLEGWTFRTAEPVFDPGEEIEVFLTGVQDGVPIARVGDSVLEVEGASADLVDNRVAVRIEGFDGDRNRGTAEYLDTVGGSAF